MEDQDRERPASGWRRLANVLLLGAWFGLVTGLVEGTGFFVFKRLGWVGWDISKLPVPEAIVPVATLFDLLLFLVVGFMLAGLAGLFATFQTLRGTVTVYGFLAFFDWLVLSGRIGDVGAFFLALGLAVTLSRLFTRRVTDALRFCHQTLPLIVVVAIVTFVGLEILPRFREEKALAALPTPPRGSPNILVVVLDTLRSDHVSAYGYGRATTPSIDRVAAQGVLFENALANSSWTLPSHGSMLTGRHPHEHGAQLNPQRFATSHLGESYPTISEVLRDRGYRTAAFSANLAWFTRWHGFGRGFIHFDDFFHSLSDAFVRTIYGRKINQYVLRPLKVRDFPSHKTAQDVNGSILKWIERKSDRPFFIFVNYFDVHDPQLTPAPFRGRFSKRAEPGGNLEDVKGKPKLTLEQLQDEVDAYDGAVAYVDHHIGQLFSRLDRDGFLNNTVVILTADHGESFGEHGLFTHRAALYRDVIQVPLIVWWPDHVPKGVRINPPASLAWLPATLMDFAGESGRGIFPGPSLAEAWSDPASLEKWPYPVQELEKIPFDGFDWAPAYHGAMWSVVTPRWHYIFHEKFGGELYDWIRDPREEHDLATSPEGARIARDLFAYLSRELPLAGEPGQKPPKRSDSP